MVVSSSSDDDGPVAPPSPRVGTPPPATLARATTHVALGATTRVVIGVPETIVTPMVEVARVTTAVPETTRAVPVAVVETPGDSADGQTSFRRGRYFWST